MTEQIYHQQGQQQLQQHTFNGIAKQKNRMINIRIEWWERDRGIKGFAEGQR